MALFYFTDLTTTMLMTVAFPSLGIPVKCMVVGLGFMYFYEIIVFPG